MKALQLALAFLVLASVGCAAERHLRDARAADLSGRPTVAHRHLQLALEKKPDLAEDPRFAAHFQRVTAESLHAQGDQMAQSNQWRAAMQHYRDAIGADSSYAPARHYKKGAALADQGKLDAAIVSMQDAVEFDASHQAAHDELAHLLELRRQRRARAAELYDRSVVLVEQQQWDEALSAVRSAQELTPNDARMAAQVKAIRMAAAKDLTSRARRQLAAGALDAAEADFDKALGYVPSHHDAKRGMANADFARGEQARRDGRPGRAMLWHLAANEHLRHPRYEEAISAARREILGQHTLDVAIRGGPSEKLAAGALTRFASNKPEYVRLTDEANADYIVDVSAANLNVRQEVVGTHQATHTYYEQRDVPNPRIPHLESKLRHAERRLAGLRRRNQHPCDACGGNGWIEVHHAERSRRDATTGKRGRIDRRGKTRRQCDRCGGSGRRNNVSHRDISRARSKVDKLRHELSCEPAYVQQRHPRHWNYTVTDYAMTSDLEAVITLADRVAGEQIDTQVVKRHFLTEDSAVANANPSIGLHDDPLQLPSNGHVRSRLIAGAADEIASRLVATIANVRRAALEAEAQRIGGEGATELRIAAALMLEPVEPARTKQLLEQLR